MRFGRYIVGLPSSDKDIKHAPSRQSSVSKQEHAAESNEEGISESEDSE